MTKKFMDENFLLDNEVSKKLYFDYAKNLPIIDYHCHLSPKEIYEDKKFKDITEAWLVDGKSGDHYKWRLLRAYGVTEDYITGNKDSKEKFLKWADAISHAIGNPVYHWAHLELKSFFNITEPLTKANAEKIYDLCNEKLKDLSARKMITDSNVKVICTTDDPVDSLEWHIKLKEDKSFDTVVLPSFRPDKAINIDNDYYSEWVKLLENRVNRKLDSFTEFEKALVERLEFFKKVGSKVSDHSLEVLEFINTTEDEAKEIYLKRLNGVKLTHEEVVKYKSYMLVFFGRNYNRLGFVQQYHISALRNNSDRLFKELGPDTGYDAIGDRPMAEALAKLLNALDYTNELPKTILYSLNPNYDQILASIGYCFNNGVKGKIQLGSGWWFNDNIDGMLRQLHAISNTGLISEFVGMLTDSRSFMSYPRHDYFRRILCNYLGTLVYNGEYPEDYNLLKEIVEGICYYNSKKYFGF